MLVNGSQLYAVQVFEKPNFTLALTQALAVWFANLIFSQQYQTAKATIELQMLKYFHQPAIA